MIFQSDWLQKLCDKLTAENKMLEKKSLKMANELKVLRAVS